MPLVNEDSFWGLSSLRTRVLHLRAFQRNKSLACACFRRLQCNSTRRARGCTSLCRLGDLFHLPMDMSASENEQRQHGESKRNGDNCEIEYSSHDY